MMARAKKIRAHLARAMREELDSGPAILATVEYWSAILPISAPRDLLEVKEGSYTIYCRPMVAQDMAALAAEIAPNDRYAANGFMCAVIREIRAIGRKPGAGIGLSGSKPADLLMRPVGRTVARIAYHLPHGSASVEITRILHRDRDRVLERWIDSSQD